MKQLPNLLCVVGMSNTGKSYWSRELAREYGYTRIEIDRLIVQALGLEESKSTQRELDEQSGNSSEIVQSNNNIHTQILREWLGTPDDAGYFERQKTYLHHEERLLLEAIRALQPHDKVIIDTTASLPHLSRQTLNDLKNAVTCVHLFDSTKSLEVRIVEYMSQTKPLIWGHFYHGNIEHDYGQLIHYRYRQYETIKERSVDVGHVNTLEEFTKAVQDSQIWPYEEYLQQHVLPQLEQGRPNWDRPHTELVVAYIKSIDETHPQLSLDRHVLVAAAYLHDWGYSTMYRGTKALFDPITMKKKHAIRSLKYWQEIQNQPPFRRFSEEQRERIGHLIRIHDDVSELQATDELVLMEADTLAALATPFSDSVFVGKSYRAYLKRTKQNRISRFITDYSKQEVKQLFAQRKKQLGLRGWFL